MEAILFIGIQAAGKSTFYKSTFADTHVRINLDMLKTRHREKRLFECCLEIRQPFVIDNTNLTRADRQRYFSSIIATDIPVQGFYFDVQLVDALERNRRRGNLAVPEKGVRGAFRRLEPPSHDEGFSRLFTVTLCDKKFYVSEQPSSSTNS